MKDKIIKGYKAFDKDFKCRGYQYKIGETYKTNDDIIICEKGFHFCENALDLFGYYAPVDSKFAEVKMKKPVDNYMLQPVKDQEEEVYPDDVDCERYHAAKDERV